MNAFAAAGLGFLLAVLWFDLMFDVQTRRHDEEVLPPEVLASISAYYRRVTTEASPMNRLVALMMLDRARRHHRRDFRRRNLGLDYLGLARAGVVRLCRDAFRTLPNAVRLGQAADPPELQSQLARSVFRDHALGFARTLADARAATCCAVGQLAIFTPQSSIVP